MNTNDSTSLQTISLDQLAGVGGGIKVPGWAKKATKFVAKKVTGPVGAAWTGYDAVDGYLTAREHGKGVGESLKQGALNAIW